MHLYRIAQKAVSNAQQHGKASAVSSGLKCETNRIALSVQDNGREISLNDKSRKRNALGLHIMNYRAALQGGKLKVLPCQQGGAAVTCALHPDAAEPAVRQRS